MRLVLWDLDHTLLAVRNISRAAYAAGFERTTGVPLTHQPAMAGRTDRAIIQDALRHHGLPMDLVDEVADAIGEEFTARSDQVRGNGRVLPGAVAALEELRRLPDVHQSVLTGNMRPIAEVKLRSLGLVHYLDMDIGAYGMDGAERWKLVPQALRRAGDKFGRPVTPEHTTLIGDTPLDVAAARRAGTGLIAVATGASSVAELRAAGAQTVLASLADTRQVRRAVRDPVP